jgi:molybdenum cofactor sulfurtransferase
VTLLICLGLSVAAWVRLKNSLSRVNRDADSLSGNRVSTPQEQDREMLARKAEFRKRAGDDYGYGESPCGFIDQWRVKEFPGLISPCSDQQDDWHGREQEVYLDYAGSALPTRSQLDAIQRQLSANVFANPHSTGPAASRTRLLMEQTKTRILDFLGAHPGRYAAFREEAFEEGSSNDSDENNEMHPGYEILFTSGTTEALRIIAERFPFNQQSVFVYPQNSHTSVIGIREPVQAKGGTFVCRTMDQLEQDFDRGDLRNDWMGEENSSSAGSLQPAKFSHLVAMPLECNFGGDRLKNCRGLISRLRQLSKGSDRFYTLLDIAKAATCSEISLTSLDPDFAVLSFYKLFGEPTGLGCLLVKRTAIGMLCRDRDRDSSRNYFGGGSADALLSTTDFYAPRTEPTPLAQLSNGTLHFRGIIALQAGFDELKRLGGMSVIQRHTACLTKELVRRLKALTHEGSGRPAIRLYGAWRNHDPGLTCNEQPCPGPIVAFNVVRDDGSYVGYNEVSKLASLNRPPVQFRTGCFCNPGACQLELDISDKNFLYNFQQAGHVCGDEVDLVNGRPTGAIRVSFGKDSTWEDLEALVSFLQRLFVQSKVKEGMIINRWDAKPRCVVVSELYLFPIKSCAAQQVKRWNIVSAGKLSYDREFALVDSTGTAMRLQTYPKLAFIRPTVDAEAEVMTVCAPGQVDLVVSLEAKSDTDLVKKGIVRVCGNRCNGSLWGDHQVSQWFSDYLGVKCFLARYASGGYELPAAQSLTATQRRGRGLAFANEQPILLLSENAVATLNEVLKSRNQRLVSPRHFRPNFVVRLNDESAVQAQGNLEDGWSTLGFQRNSDLQFEVAGPCPRCSMVDVDPTSGMKGKTLRALAEYRRENGQINFGIFLRKSRPVASNTTAWVEVGDIILCD